MATLLQHWCFCGSGCWAAVEQKQAQERSCTLHGGLHERLGQSQVWGWTSELRAALQGRKSLGVWVDEKQRLLHPWRDSAVDGDLGS